MLLLLLLLLHLHDLHHLHLVAGCTVLDIRLTSFVLRRLLLDVLNVLDVLHVGNIGDLAALLKDLHVGLVHAVGVEVVTILRRLRLVFGLLLGRRGLLLGHVVVGSDLLGHDLIELLIDLLKVRLIGDNLWRL